MTAVRTKFKQHDVVKFVNASDPTDPNNGSHVVITAINPVPALFGSREHYRIYVPALKDETYALANELEEKR